jgi:hypothetical protein
VGVFQVGRVIHYYIRVNALDLDALDHPSVALGPLASVANDGKNHYLRIYQFCV